MKAKALLVSLSSLAALGLVLVVLSVAGPEVAAAPAPAQDPDPFVGNAMCVRCHQDVQQAMVTEPHGAGQADLADRGCQSCHGPGRLHVQRPEEVRHQPRVSSLSAERQGQLCGDCHGDMRPVSTAHTVAQVACNGCHTFHRREGQPLVLAWQTKCLSCHAGSEPYDELHSYDEEALTAGTVSCTSCHGQGHGAPETASAD